MHILFVTSEVAGVFKLGGLADVSRALPQALARIGLEVTVALPFYSSIDVTGVKGLGELAVDYGNKREIVFLFSKPLSPDGGTLLLFRHPKLNEYKKKPIEETFAFFSKAVSTFYLHGSHLVKHPVDIVHCHDWHTALVPLLIGEENKLTPKRSVQSRQVKTIFTIHNLLYQGVAPDTITDSLNAPRGLFHVVSKSRKNRISFMREGLEYADIITTVSPTYAKEIVVSSHHDAIGEVLVRRKSLMRGILNGIDTTLWNPENDPFIAQPYSSSTVLNIKPLLSRALAAEVGLPNDDSPILGFIGRIEPRQKGIELIIEAAKKLLEKQDLRFVILGTGDKKTTQTLTEFARTTKSRVVFVNAFDEGLAHRIYAGSDMLLVPSKFEPCGLTQLIAMRYGTVPIVRETGGLADTVTDPSAGSGPGTGFVFHGYNAASLSSGILRALAARIDASRWSTIVRAGMDQDFSWTKSAKTYHELYRSLMSLYTK